MITCSSPGKLYIAGEYAVIEKGYPSILIAVDQFIKVSLSESLNRGSIQAFNNHPIAFDRRDHGIVLDYRDNNLSYVVNSIKLVENLAKELNKELKFYDLRVDSELQNNDGRKYGLGSSAAVTVSTLKVLCKYYKIELSDLELFKLSALVHLNILSNGSCGDIAASVYTGYVYFKTFDREWVLSKMKNHSVLEMLKMEWPNLEIRHLNVPKEISVLIGWTGSPASTTRLVDALNMNLVDHQLIYNKFLEESRTCVEEIVTSCDEHNIVGIKDGINKNRKLLQGLSRDLGLIIETDKLKTLSNIAHKYNGASKSSGAGGGDCGIALLDNHKFKEDIIKEWQANDIEHLDLNIYFKGE